MYDKHRVHSRNGAIIVDVVHIVMGILIVILAIFTFIHPEQNLFLFPLVFLLASALNFMNSIYKMRQSGREKKKKINALGQLGIAILLVVMTVISGISIWG